MEEESVGELKSVWNRVFLLVAEEGREGRAEATAEESHEPRPGAFHKEAERWAWRCESRWRTQSASAENELQDNQ
jgi:hypothetical protein